jgi:hypothetical protein
MSGYVKWFKFDLRGGEVGWCSMETTVLIMAIDCMCHSVEGLDPVIYMHHVNKLFQKQMITLNGPDWF